MQHRVSLFWLFGFHLAGLLLSGCEDTTSRFTLEVESGNFSDEETSTAVIESIWTERNVFHEGDKGMRLHVQFEIYGQKGRNCSVGAYFYFENGEPLEDFNGRYVNRGNVSLKEFFTPLYEGTLYKDFAVFMPYDELDLEDGEYELKFYLVVWGRDENDEWQKLAVSEWFHFVYTQ